jgi:hypothetical protein
MPDTKKSIYVTYKGTKIEPLNDTNIYSWIDAATNVFIIEDLWQYVEPSQAIPLLEKAQKDDKDTIRQFAIARSVLSLFITHDLWQQFKDLDHAHQVWTRILSKAEQLKAEREALYL